MRKIFLLIAALCLVAIEGSAQIDGYYRLRNGSGVDGRAYLNVQTERLEPTMTDADVTTQASSVFHVTTGPSLATGLLATPYYRVETLTAQDVDAMQMFTSIKSTMAAIPQLVFNAVWGIAKTAIESNETVKEQVDAINTRYGINLDDFTYEEYKKWVETFDTNLYMERNSRLSQLLNGGEAYKLYINLPDLPDPLRKENTETVLFIPVTHKSQDDLNAALLIIGPIIKESVKLALKNNTIVSAVINENTLPSLFMMLDALDRIQFGKKLYIIEDNAEAKLTFARESSGVSGALDLGSILWAGNHGLWSLQPIDDAHPFTIGVDDSHTTPWGTWLTTFYADFPYRLRDEQKAYVVGDVTTTGSLLGGYTGHTTPTLIAAQGDIVPARTPVLIETRSADAAANRIEPVVSDAALADKNILTGTLRDVEYGLLLNPRSSYRVLGSESGQPVFLQPTSSHQQLQQNTAYIESGALPLVGVLQRPATVLLELEVPTVAVKLAKEKVTFCSHRDLDFSTAGVKAYVVTELHPGYAVLEQVQSAKAGTGLILEGTAGEEYLIPETGEAAAVAGKLVGTVQAKTLRRDEAFLLHNGVFKRSEAGTLPAGKAYLPATAVPAAGRELRVVLADEVTGVIDTAADGQPAALPYYDLSGRRVDKPGKGVYIVGGKKTVVR